MIFRQLFDYTSYTYSYLLADRAGGEALIIDPVLERVDRYIQLLGELDLKLVKAVDTHVHADHITGLGALRDRTRCVTVMGKESGVDVVSMRVEDGDHITAGGIALTAMYTPGHTDDSYSFLLDNMIFTGDTLFRGSVGGTRAPGHATFEDIRNSIMEVLMRLPKGMAVHPGHTDSTTIGEEWEQNPFIRLWRGLDEPDEKRCRAAGKPATLLLRARDYDGGTKCWVRFDEGGVLDIVAGSQVKDA